MVGAALGRDCFLDQGYFTVYPNLFIALVGQSASRKSTAIGQARKFLMACEPKINVLCDKMTPEKLINELSGLKGQAGDNYVLSTAEGIAIPDELSTLVDKNSFKNGMISVLTRLYDNDDFSYGTLARGKEVIRNPCLSLMGGTTITWIKETIPDVSVEGGFTGRTIFVYQKTSDKRVPWPRMSDENKKRKEDILHDLGKVAGMRGVFGITDDALTMYEKEYIRFFNFSELIHDKYLHSYAGRRMTTLLKVAMIHAASRSDDMLINIDDISVALALLSEAEKHMPSVLRSIMSKEVGDVFDEIVYFVQRKMRLNKRQLITKFRHKMTAQELDVMMSTLEQQGVVSIQYADGETLYTFTGGS